MYGFAAALIACPNDRGASLSARGLTLTPATPELDPRHGGDQRLVDVLDRLDKVRLAEDEVGVVGLLDLDRDELHDRCSALASHLAGHPGHFTSRSGECVK